MWFRLAALWGCPVAEAQARIDSVEFAEWIAYHRIEPWGCYAEDIRHAMRHFQYAYAHSKEGSRPQIDNSFPPWARQKREGAQDPREMQQAVRNWLGRA